MNKNFIAGLLTLLFVGWCILSGYAVVSKNDIAAFFVVAPLITMLVYSIFILIRTMIE